MKSILLFITSIILSSSINAQEIQVGRKIATDLERKCELDILSDGVYSGLITKGAGNIILPSKKDCTWLTTTNVEEPKYNSHKNTTITWEYYITHINIYANGIKMANTGVSHWSFSKPKLQVTALGRMTIVDVNNKSYVFDNQEQKWCLNPLLKNDVDKTVEVNYWYHRPTRNVIRVSQNETFGVVQKTQHYLPEICNSYFNK